MLAAVLATDEPTGVPTTQRRQGGVVRADQQLVPAGGLAAPAAHASAAAPRAALRRRAGHRRRTPLSRQLQVIQSQTHSIEMNLQFKGFVKYDTRCYFNVRSKADISQLNLPHGTDN